MITIIAACSKNRVLGKNNKLIWNLPEDLKKFKESTLGHPIVMGRKTYESIGRPLPNRTNIILTRNKNYFVKGCLVYNDFRDILDIWEKNNIFIIGGSEIYKIFLPFTDKIELTLIDKDFVGDTFFPELGNEWCETSVQSKSNNEFEYKYITYIKR